MAVLEGLILGMDLSEKDRETLRQIHSPIQHQMRLAHYLPLSIENQEDPRKIRLAPHKDFAYNYLSPYFQVGADIGCRSYTLLFQESQSGLEFQNRETGEYISAIPKEGVLYLNVGNLFERYSNGMHASKAVFFTAPKH